MPYYKTEIKKGGIYQYRVVINYTDPQGSYRKKESTAWGLQEAKAKLLKMEQSKQVGETLSITVSQLATEYLKAKQYEVRETTLDTSARNLNRYIIPFLGETLLNKLDAKKLAGWKLSMEQLGLSLTTRQNIFSELRSLLSYGIRMDYLKINPLAKVGNFKDAYETPKKMSFYVPDEFRKYKATAMDLSAKKGYMSFYVFFCIAYYTGARKGEIHALRWADIEGERLRIDKSIGQKLKGEDRETPPKNKSSVRTLQIPKPLLEILDEHYKRQTEPSPNDHICGGLKPLRDTSIDKFNRSVAETAGLPRIRIHDFRHSHASTLIDGGIAITEIARRLGHSDIKETLNTYAHFFPKQEEKAVDILNKIF